MDEEEYRKRLEEVYSRITDKKISKKIDTYLRKISELTDCNVELNFSIIPELDKYQEIRDEDTYHIPEAPTMKLGTFVDHLNKEADGELGIYIDPIYLKSGVNEIIDIIITTVDEKMILVPMSNKNQPKL